MHFFMAVVCYDAHPHDMTPRSTQALKDTLGYSLEQRIFFFAGVT
jgi:hypothetical protein